MEIPNNHSIVVSNLSKVYADGTKALDNVSFSVENGIICIVGPNGAGKTTLVKIISTQLRYTQGKVNVLGYDIEKDVNKIRERIAVVPQEGLPVNELTPFEHIYYYLLARGMDRKKARDNTEHTLKNLDLWQIKDRLAVKLSGGLKRRILIAMALSTEADLMLLDEPSVGLDPASRKETWDVITNIVEDKKKTIILTTHYMEEAEALSKEVIVVNKGKILAKGSTEELKKNLHFEKKISVEKHVNREFLVQLGKTISYGNSWFIYPDDLNYAVNILLSKNINFQIMPTSLEDVFIEVTENG